MRTHARDTEETRNTTLAGAGQRGSQESLQEPSPLTLPSPQGPVSQVTGSLLIEYLIYIAVLALVMELAFSAFYRSLDNSRGLGRNAEDILRVLGVGEAWRKDVREAVAPPKLITEDRLTACEIQKKSDLVVYLFGEGSVWRKEGPAAPREILPRVKSSTMLLDKREKITSWRWEIELVTKKKGARLRPLFTFQAVPMAQTRQ